MNEWYTARGISRWWKLALAGICLGLTPVVRGEMAGSGPSPAMLEFEPPERGAQGPDWLLDPSPYRAGVYRGRHDHEVLLSNGLIRRTFRLAPNAATVGFDNLITGESVIRGVKPEARVNIDGVAYDVGGLHGQPNYAFLRADWIDQLTADPAAFQFSGLEIGAPRERFGWKRVRHHAPGLNWPPTGVHLRMDYVRTIDGDDVRVSVHYELYDGIPCLSKWITVHNDTGKRITVNRFTSEILAAVEHTSRVEDRGDYFPPPNLLVETDYAFQGMDPETVSRFSVHWVNDPDYASQVSYLRTTPCQLEVRPAVGPEQEVAPGEYFESFRAFIAPYDATDRERQGLTRRRIYRTIAPWTTENPLMMHARFADWDRVKLAIDQCADVGFEMVILTFGSGFDIENESPAYLEQMKQFADYARERGVELGGYSLLSSRRIGDGHDVVSPPGESPTHGNCPALTSAWGQDYFRKLYQFFEKTGHRVLEHDGSYPGDIDITARPPLQKGKDDSRWAQWKIITRFYQWCREQGIYLNVPDYYFLAGSTKCAMGYREVNWSLPRDQQVIHTRQNIYDGTWTKLPSMGWMFVPLTQYHGGGAAATIEPLDQHRDHYQRMLTSNLALGVQACYRGPRLYDTPATRELVTRWVDWFRTYRNILESDLIHGRRADGRGLDWMLHVNPALDHKGMLVVFNPLAEAVEETLRVPLYYTGLTRTASVSCEGTPGVVMELERDFSIHLPVRVPPQGMSWYLITPDTTHAQEQ